MKRKIASVITLMSVATFVYAGFEGPGSEPHIGTVESVLTMSDDMPVTVQGKLTEKLEEEHFIFKDSTGEIEVEIDDDLLKERIITPENKIQITGEVDIEDSIVTIEADSLKVIS